MTHRQFAKKARLHGPTSAPICARDSATLDTAAFEHQESRRINVDEITQLISDRLTYRHMAVGRLGMDRSWSCHVWLAIQRLVADVWIELHRAGRVLRPAFAAPAQLPPQTAVPTKHNELQARPAQSRARWLRHRLLGSELAPGRAFQRHRLAHNAS